MSDTAAWPTDPPPLVVVGPTAAGKTAVAVELAERAGGEIINADSMQVYVGMDVGTAKPTPDEQARARFHLLDVVRPDTPFNVSEWKRLAENAVADISRRGRRVIFCGGTGMYLRALLDGWTLAETPADPDVRARLKAEAETNGVPALHARLTQQDPETAARLHPNDTTRVVRALEVLVVSGRPLSVWLRANKEAAAPRPARVIGLNLPRPELYARIEARVDAMIASGLVAEVQALLAQGFAPDLSPLRSLGYKEVIEHLRGETDLPDTVRDIKQNTRRFAKRQLTWFRADPRVGWRDVSALSSAQIAEAIRTKARG